MLQKLTSRCRQRREPETHRTAARAVVAVAGRRLHRAAIEPHQPESRPWHLKQRCEPVLRPGAVGMGRERPRPGPAVVLRVRQPHIVRVVIRTALLQPMTDERAGREAHNRGHVRPIDEPIRSRRDGSWRRPASGRPLGESKGRVRSVPFDPAQDDATRGSGELGLPAIRACGRSNRRDRSQRGRTGRSLRLGEDAACGRDCTNENTCVTVTHRANHKT